jgi:hypothetical protein
MGGDETVTTEELLRIRLANQQISSTGFSRPADLLAWLCGLQAQDYGQAKWAIGSRLAHAVDADVEKAVSGKSIVRGWFMRGTLHMVAAGDVRWLLDLMAPRIVAKAAGRNRQLGLDEKTFARCAKALARSLRGGKALTRAELTETLARAGIQASGVRLSHVIQRAAVDRVISLGPRRGSEPTHVLFDEWVPEARPLEREAALGLLARRYFRSRGPATLKDFAWWSGLTGADAKAGLAGAGPGFVQEKIAGQVYWLPEGAPAAAKASAVHLLAGFDEYILGYADRALCLAAAHAKKLVGDNGIFRPVIVVNGKASGTWSRVLKKDRVAVEIEPFVPFGRNVRQAVAAAARRYATFAGKTIHEEDSDAA